MNHVFVGFGFGPIQAGLFAKEAYASGAFSEIVIAEIDATLAGAIRSNGNRYAINIAGDTGLHVDHVEGVRMLNPLDPHDRDELVAALARATEIATCLPSVDVYTHGNPSVASLIAEGLTSGRAPATLVYTAENNNHAAEALSEAVYAQRQPGRDSRPCQFVNTVIGKMSQVILDATEISRRKLLPITPELPRAFLVESFNHILVSRIRLTGFTPGIRVFEEKDDLLPFEEAKLYGHNAIHTLMGFLATAAGLHAMSDITRRPDILSTARQAFVGECGAALIRKYSGIAPLFTQAGLTAYADDLLGRIVNPYLHDSVVRATRDLKRKLGPDDRVFGTMRLAIQQGIEPVNLARGAATALQLVLNGHESGGVLPQWKGRDVRDLDTNTAAALLTDLWADCEVPPEIEELSTRVAEASRDCSHISPCNGTRAPVRR